MSTLRLLPSLARFFVAVSAVCVTVVSVALADVDAKDQSRLVVNSGHGGVIQSIAFSPDGKTLASGSEDKSIKLWDVASGRELRSLTGHDDVVMSVAFSPDGKTLASGSWDKSVKLWEVASGLERRSLKGHSDWVNSVAFSPDGKTLASGGEGYSILLLDVTSGRELRRLRANFQDEQRFNDHLKLSQRFNQRLAQDSRSAACGSVSFVDADEFPDAWSVNGRYEVAAEAVRLKAKLFYGGQVKGDLSLSLPLDAEEQIKVLYQSVRDAVN